MGASATFKNKKVIALINEMSKKTKQIASKDKKVANLMAAVVFKDVIDHFENEAGEKGRWKPWSTSYSRFMGKIGKSGNKILQDNGRLRNSFIPSNYRVVSDGIVWFNPAKTKKGFPYAFAHNEGGGKLPKRKFMWLSNNALGEMEVKIVKFLES